LAWQIRLSASALKALKKLDRKEARRIRDFLKGLESLENPRLKEKPLSGPLGYFWCYRVGSYRLICDIQDDVLTVLVLRIGHRREVYRIN